jgi:hypothetical protein
LEVVNQVANSQDSPPIESPRRKMNKRRTWVRADKLQPGDRIQDTNGNIVTIKEATKGIFPGSILITLEDADPDFVYLEPDTKIFVE